MNYQCNSCGAPNISSTNCQYCSSKIEGKNQSISKTDKGMFDLAIYELKEGEEGDEEALEKSLKLFNKIITKDPDNYSAWLYKMICEFRLDSETKKFIKKVTANHKIQSIPIFEDLFLALLKDGLLPEEVKSTNYLFR